jgi:anti-sigma B factor antagonist
MSSQVKGVRVDWLSIQCSEGDGAVVVQIGGELDVATAPLLRALIGALVLAGNCRLVLDLEELTFLDASGLSVLMRAQELAVRDGGWVRLVRVRPQARRVLHLTRLTQVFAEFPSFAQALNQKPTAGHSNSMPA